MENCIFCKIINKDIESDIIYENEKAVVFPDINPRAKVHLLIVSKKHIESIKEDNSEDIVRDLIVLAKKVAVDKGFDSYKLVFNVGRKAGQTVDHLHMHLLSGGSINK